MDKVHLESNTVEDMVTPPSFITQRHKRVKESDYESDFNVFRNEIKDMISAMMTAQHEEMKKIYPTLMEIKNTNINVEKSIIFLTEQNDELKKKIEQLQCQAKKDNDYITILEEKIEDMQRFSRKSSVEIKNVPKIQHEAAQDLLKMVTKLSDVVGCNIRGPDIKDIYRVNKAQSKHGNSNHPITVELSSTLLKMEFLKKIKEFNVKQKEKLCAKHLGFTKDEYTPIYVSEQLTAKGARLHFLARELVKSRKYKFCWTAFGRVYVRRDENSPVIIIRTESQVNSLIQAA